MINNYLLTKIIPTRMTTDCHTIYYLLQKAISVAIKQLVNNIKIKDSNELSLYLMV